MTSSFLNLVAVHWWRVHSGVLFITGDVFELARLQPTLFQAMQPGANQRAAAARCPWRKEKEKMKRRRRGGERDRKKE